MNLSILDSKNRIRLQIQHKNGTKSVNKSLRDSNLSGPIFGRIYIVGNSDVCTVREISGIFTEKLLSLSYYVTVSCPNDRIILSHYPCTTDRFFCTDTFKGYVMLVIVPSRCVQNDSTIRLEVATLTDFPIVQIPVLHSYNLRKIFNLIIRHR